EGVPPYVICTNKELAAIAARRPQTLAALMQIEGFGKAKADKYGAAMLDLLATPPKAPAKEKINGQAVPGEQAE
ncbi:MAG: HRDC domain-containing protein, partial [Pseudomonadota bacterium]